jgi:RNA polymerase sigma-70 factor (ECF subfamily)
MQDRRSQIEDELLVVDAQSGDQSAMESLVRRWQRRLWHYALRLTGDREAAWDVTQQAWLGIVKGLQKLHDPAKFRAWAYRITSNKAADWVRAKASLPQAPLRDIQDPQRCSDGATTVNELLQLMDAEKRTVICLYYFENLSVAEMSDALDIPPGTVKSRLHAARNQLKELWRKQSDP